MPRQTKAGANDSQSGNMASMGIVIEMISLRPSAAGKCTPLVIPTYITARTSNKTRHNPAGTGCMVSQM